MLSVSVKTIRREIARDHLRAMKIGRIWRVRAAELDDYLRRQERRNRQNTLTYGPP